jgi:Family of unknown function (DUF6152)
MKHTYERVWLAVFAWLALLSAPAFAHHSVTAQFDPSKEFTVTGVLKHVDWTNPHIYVWVEAKGVDGTLVTWSFEGNPPGLLHRAGVTKDVFKVGETVTVTAMPANDGTKNLGFGKVYRYADGHEIRLSIARE